MDFDLQHQHFLGLPKWVSRGKASGSGSRSSVLFATCKHCLWERNRVAHGKTVSSINKFVQCGHMRCRVLSSVGILMVSSLFCAACDLEKSFVRIEGD